MKEETIKTFLELAHAYQETAEPDVELWYAYGRKSAWQDGFWTAINFAESYLKGKKE